VQAGDDVLHDILPVKVAEHLKRRQLLDRLPSITPQCADGSPLQESVAPAARADRRGTSCSMPNNIVSASGKMPAAADFGPALRRRSSATATASGEVPYKQRHEGVSVLFADIVGFTTISKEVEPDEVMAMLHELFFAYDALCEQYGVYKVETIGESAASRRRRQLRRGS
jgi:hypothetical protein